MKRRKTVILSAVVLALVPAWFLCVDRSYFLEECTDCLWQRDLYQYRLFTIPIHEMTVEHESFIQLVGRDLGSPCPHPAIQRWHRQRWWGLYICARPCASGITGFTWDRPGYEDTYTARIKAMAADDPSLPEEFHRRVFKEHDYEYVDQFKKRLANFKID